MESKSKNKHSEEHKQKKAGSNNWLTLWPNISSTKDSTRIIFPTAPIILGIIVSATILGWIFFNTSGSSVSEQEQMMKIISKVIELPDESPQIAVVSDASLLNQPFFAPAQNGDYVIVYQQTQKVLLYRPSTRKIINFANIQVPVSEEMGRFQLNN